MRNQEKKDFPYRLYLVVSWQDCLGKDIHEIVKKAIKGGVDLVQLREKNISTPLFIQRAIEIKETLSLYNVPLVINDNIEVARACDSFGIHVGNSDISPERIRNEWHQCQMLGYSVEKIEYIHSESAKHADYLGVSPVFLSKTKTDTITQWGLEGLQNIRNSTQKPLVAIGNINIQNAKEVIEHGADCLAVVSAICASENPEKAAYEIRNQIEKSK